MRVEAKQKGNAPLKMKVKVKVQKKKHRNAYQKVSRDTMNGKKINHKLNLNSI